MKGLKKLCCTYRRDCLCNLVSSASFKYAVEPLNPSTPTKNNYFKGPVWCSSFLFVWTNSTIISRMRKCWCEVNCCQCWLVLSIRAVVTPLSWSCYVNMLLLLLEEERDCELNDVNCVCMLKTCESNLCHFCRKDPHHSGEDVVANLRRWNRNSVDVEGVIKEMQARLILVQKHTLNHFLGNKNLLSESSIS